MTMSVEYPRFPLGFISPANRTISNKPCPIKMLPSSHAFADLCERLKVEPLSGQKRVLFEVRDDGGTDRQETASLPLHRPVTTVRPDTATAEVLLDEQQDLGTVAVLTHRQARPHLPADHESRPR